MIQECYQLRVQVKYSVSCSVVREDMLTFFRFLLFAIFAVIKVTTQDPDCGLFRNWLDARSHNLGHLLVERNQAMNYDEAAQFCANKQSHLIEIDTQEQMNIIADKLNSISGGVAVVVWRPAELLALPLAGKGWWGSATKEHGRWIWPNSGKL